MAECAFSIAGVIEFDQIPIVAIMTVRTLAFIVIDRGFFLMTGQAIGAVGMIERGVVPVFGVIVTVGAYPVIMTLGGLLRVARFAFAHVGVIIFGIFPCLGAGVACAAIARVVRHGFLK